MTHLDVDGCMFQDNISACAIAGASFVSSFQVVFVMLTPVREADFS
jgi:hypothetical protein